MFQIAHFCVVFLLLRQLSIRHDIPVKIRTLKMLSVRTRHTLDKVQLHMYNLCHRNRLFLRTKYSNYLESMTVNITLTTASIVQAPFFIMNFYHFGC